MTGRETDPYGAHRFRVTCDVIPALGFTGVRGLAVRVAVDDADEATSEPNRPQALPDRITRSPANAPPARRVTRSPPLELRRGVTDEPALWEWLQAWAAGEVDPQDVYVCLLDGRGDPVRGWVCRDATPVRWSGPDLVADRATVAVETLELAHEGIDAVSDLAECGES